MLLNLGDFVFAAQLLVESIDGVLQKRTSTQILAWREAPCRMLAYANRLEGQGTHWIFVSAMLPCFEV